jgi:hypothetical protein
MIMMFTQCPVTGMLVKWENAQTIINDYDLHKNDKILT